LNKGIINTEDLYAGLDNNFPFLVFSKGHCYLAQLAVLDAVCGRSAYCESYLSPHSSYFGHPKRSERNRNFAVSSGSLGQGEVFANGIALALKRSASEQFVMSIIGDGELNEGSCQEAFSFASQHKVPHVFIIDNNRQMSLGRTDDIQSNGHIRRRFQAIGVTTFILNGHSVSEITDFLDHCFNNRPICEPIAVILDTVKGSGVSFMEGNPKWHHRRFRDDEYERAINELELR